MTVSQRTGHAHDTSTTLMQRRNFRRMATVPPKAPTETFRIAKYTHMSEFILKTMLVTTVMHLLMSNKEKENNEKEEIEGIEF